jgi:exonuclease VII large subunit
MQRSAERSLETQKHNLEREHERLRAYSPQQTLKRGFALVAKNRTVVSRAEDLGANDGVTIRFYDGTVRATVTGKEEA